MQNDEIKTLWEDFLRDYKNYLLTDEDIWINNLNKLINFIEKNGKTFKEF